MNIEIITLFPEMFAGVFDHGMILKAKKESLASIELVNLRDFGLGPRRQVDDTPYGGGDGMVLKPEPLVAAIEAAKLKVAGKRLKGRKERTKSREQEEGRAPSSKLQGPTSKVILLTPRGHRYNQAKARELAKVDNMILVCGRYEGYDERITDWIDEQISVGDYVLTGGEIPAMTVVDSVVRLIPGVLGGETSAEIESFSNGGTVEYPQYTRPEIFKNKPVPKLLLSGDHGRIEAWRKTQSEQRTKEIK